MAGIGGCYGPSDYERQKLQGYSKRHYTRWEIEELAGRGGWDYFIGSVHYIGEWNFDNPALKQKFSDFGTEEAWDRYWKLFANAARSGFFEIIESIVAEIVAPGKGVDWLGGQGDEWDAQNDMLAAVIGAIMMMALVALTERKTRNR